MDDDLGWAFRCALASEARSLGELTPSAVARAVVSALPADAAGITLVGAQLRVPIGSSGPEAARAERIQATLGDGPCVDAVRRDRPVLWSPEDLNRDWPVFFAELAARTPYRWILAVPLSDDDGVFAALDVYAGAEGFGRRPDPETVSYAIGGLAARVVLSAPGTTDPDLDTERHSGSYHDRLGVWTATGMIMGAGDLDSDDALALLRGVAFARGISLDELGRRLVGGEVSTAEVVTP